MKSSTDQYWIALDHVRALAALMVFIWHFTHGTPGYPVPFEGAPAIFPLALFDEGHVGVSVFMVLSGYLFAKLLDGKAIDYPKFFWNRFIRLAPLLLVVMALKGLQLALTGGDLSEYGLSLLKGFVVPAWPSGGWSITVELHFYLILPFLLAISNRDPRWLLAVLGAAIALRAGIFWTTGTAQDAGYWTIFGRIDQFLLGMLIFMRGAWVAERTSWVIAIVVGFTGFYWLFDMMGGYNDFGGAYPSPSPLWIILPTIEAVAFAVALAWYDRRYAAGSGPIARFIASYGTFSYSIYLLHPFIVFRASKFIHEHIMSLENFYLASFVGLLVFLGMYPIGWLSYNFIEKPALRFRTRYVMAKAQAS